MTDEYTPANPGAHFFSNNVFAVLLFHANQQCFKKNSDFCVRAEALMESLGVDNVEELKDRLHELSGTIIEWEEIHESGRRWTSTPLLDYWRLEIKDATGEPWVHWAYPEPIRAQLLTPASGRSKGFTDAFASKFKFGSVALDGF